MLLAIASRRFLGWLAMSWCERIASGETHRDDDSGVLPDGLPCRARLGESEEEGALHFFCMKGLTVSDGLP